MPTEPPKLKANLENKLLVNKGSLVTTSLKPTNSLLLKASLQRTPDQNATTAKPKLTGSSLTSTLVTTISMPSKTLKTDLHLSSASTLLLPSSSTTQTKQLFYTPKTSCLLTTQSTVSTQLKIPAYATHPIITSVFPTPPVTKVAALQSAPMKSIQAKASKPSKSAVAKETTLKDRVAQEPELENEAAVSLMEAMDLDGVIFKRSDEVLSNLPVVSFDHFRRSAEVKTIADNMAQSARQLKIRFINTVSGILLKNANFMSPRDADRNLLMEQADAIVATDPEFILKVALYARRELNIRTCSNFLLALAAHLEPCRCYLKKYFTVSINLPSDWLETAELYCTFTNSELRAGALPVALRKVMVSKFPEFDEYQLAKYNKDKSKKKKKPKSEKAKEESTTSRSTRGGRGRAGTVPATTRTTTSASNQRTASASVRGRGRGRGRGGRGASRGGRGGSSSSRGRSPSPPATKAKDRGRSRSRSPSLGRVNEDPEEKEISAAVCFSLKKLIRQLHISQPVNAVLCLLGKRYPAILEEFYRLKLPGEWDSTKAGKRMRLPVPETWETQVSLKGNKAPVWESLLEHRKLPYMAMLRNLRNMIKAGIASQFHHQVLSKICDEGAVINSKQLPVRFFSAYKVLDEMQKEMAPEEELIEAVEKLKKQLTELQGKAKRLGKGQDKKEEADKLRESMGILKRRIKDKEKSVTTAANVTPKLLAEYRQALDKAVIVATKFNLPPIRGRSLVVLQYSAAVNLDSLGDAGSRGPIQFYVLALMCQYACERCDLYLRISGNDGELGEMVYVPTSSLEEGILGNIRHIISAGKDDEAVKCPESLFWRRMYETGDRFDSIIIFGGSSVSSGFLLSYKQDVNPSALLIQIGAPSAVSNTASDSSPLEDPVVRINGVSDQILRFIAERGDSALLQRVEDIDVRYKLLNNVTTTSRANMKAARDEDLVRMRTLVPQLLHNVAPPASRLAQWRPYRVFISSPFRDMHGERDLLTRLLMPYLRRELEPLGVDVLDVDLRWGIPEDTAMHSGSALTRCLDYARRAHFFVGLYGQRLGWVPSVEQLSQLADELQRRLPKSVWGVYSITMLELLAFLGDEGVERANRAFLCFRDPAALTHVPTAYRKDFIGDDTNIIQRYKMDAARRGVCIMEDYSAHWGGVVKGKPVMKGLQQLYQYLFNSLACAMKAVATKDKENLESSPGAADTESLTEFSSEMQHLVRRLRHSFIACEKSLGAVQDLLEKEMTNMLMKLARQRQLEAEEKNRTAVQVDLPGSRSAPTTSLLKPNLKPLGGILLIAGVRHSGKSVFLAGLAKHLEGDRSNKLRTQTASQKSDKQTVVLSHFVSPVLVPGSERLSLMLKYWIRVILLRCNEAAISASSEETFGGDSMDNTSTGISGLVLVQLIARLAEVSNVEDEDRACEALIPLFHEVLNMVANVSNLRFFLLADGMEDMAKESNVLTFTWLPECLPGNVTLLLSCKENGALHKALQANRKDVLNFSLPVLDPTSRAGILRTLLLRYGKELQEKGLNNQMRAITMKHGANSPFYLNLVAEELRLHGVYEKLDEKLKQLPHSANDLVAFMLRSIQAECGEELTNAVLLLLSCSWEGVKHNDMRALLAILRQALRQPTAANQQTGARWNTVLQWTNKWNCLNTLPSEMELDYVMEHLRCFLSTLPHTDNSSSAPSLYQLGCEDVRTVVHTIVMGSNVTDMKQLVHTVFACYYESSLFGEDNDLEINSQSYCSALHGITTMELPRHLFYAGQWDRFERLLTRLLYVRVCVNLALVDILLEAYAGFVLTKKSEEREWVRITNSPTFKDFHAFVKRNAAILRCNPWLLTQQALNEPEESCVYQSARATSGDGLASPHMLIVSKQNGKTDKRPGQRNIEVETTWRITNSTSGASVAVTCVRFSPEVPCGGAARVSDASASLTVTSTAGGIASKLAIGLQNGGIRIYDCATMKQEHSLLAHSDAVTDLCFMQASVAGHVEGLRLCSVSRDSATHLWDLQSGHRTHSLGGHQRTISGCCTDWYSGCQWLVTAGLDGFLRVWSTRDLKKKFPQKEWKLSRPLNSVAIHPHGHLVLVGCWDKTLKLYSLSSWRRVAVLRGHDTAIQIAQFSPTTGEHIVSCGMRGEVMLWHSATGQFLGLLRTPGEGLLSSPVTGMSYVGEARMDAREIVITDGLGRVQIVGANLGVLIGDICPENLSISKERQSKSKPVAVTTVAVWSPLNLLAVGTREGDLFLYESREPWNLLTKIERVFSTLQVSSDSSPRALDGLVWWPCSTSNRELLLLVCMAGEHTMVLQFMRHTTQLILVAGSSDTNERLASLHLPPNESILCASGDVPSSLNCCIMARSTEQSCSVYLQLLSFNSMSGPQGRLTVDVRSCPKRHCLTQHEGPVPAVDWLWQSGAATANSQIWWLATVGHDMSVCIYEVKGDRTERRGTPRLTTWSIASAPRLMIHLPKAHPDWITAVAWRRKQAKECEESQEPAELVLGSADHSVSLWKVVDSPSGEKMLEDSGVRLQGHHMSISGLQYKQGCIVSVSVDGVCKVWTRQGQLVSTIHTPIAGDGVLPNAAQDLNGISCVLLTLNDIEAPNSTTPDKKSKSKEEETTASEDDTGLEMIMQQAEMRIKMKEALVKQQHQRAGKSKKEISHARAVKKKEEEREEKRQKRASMSTNPKYTSSWAMDDSSESEADTEDNTVHKAPSNTSSASLTGVRISRLVESTLLFLASQSGHVRVYQPLKALSASNQQLHHGGACVAVRCRSMSHGTIMAQIVTGGREDAACHMINWPLLTDARAMPLMERFSLNSPPHVDGGVSQCSPLFTLTPTNNSSNPRYFIALAGNLPMLLVCELILDSRGYESPRLQSRAWLRLPLDVTDDSLWVKQILVTGTEPHNTKLLVLSGCSVFEVKDLDRLLADSMGVKVPTVRQIIGLDQSNYLAIRRMDLVPNDESGALTLECLSALGGLNSEMVLCDRKKGISLSSVGGESGWDALKKLAERCTSSQLVSFSTFSLSNDNVSVGVTASGDLLLQGLLDRQELVYRNTFLPSSKSRVYPLYKAEFSMLKALVAVDNGDGILQFVGVTETSAPQGPLLPVGIYHMPASTTGVAALVDPADQQRVFFVVGDVLGDVHLLQANIK